MFMMMNPMMYSAMMYSPMIYNSMYEPMMSPNTPSYFQQKYGSGPADFATRPYIKANPYGVMDCYRAHANTQEEEKGSGIVKAFKSYFA